MNARFILLCSRFFLVQQQICICSQNKEKIVYLIEKKYNYDLHYEVTTQSAASNFIPTSLKENFVQLQMFSMSRKSNTILDLSVGIASTNIFDITETEFCSVKNIVNKLQEF